MMYNFIHNKDIDVSIKQYFLEQLVAGVPHALKTAEGAAFSLIKSMLNSRYDLVKLFPVIKEWNPATNYKKGDYVCKNDIIYKAKQDNTNQIPVNAENNNWEQSDPRDQLLVLHAVNITIFFICERANPRKLPEDIVDAYNRALNWLEGVKQGNENPDFPLLETEGLEVKGGSNPKLDHYY